MEKNEQLRKYAKGHGFTHKQLANHLGLARETVTRVINDRAPVTKGIIGRFFIAFGPEETNRVFGTEPTEPEAAA